MWNYLEIGLEVAYVHSFSKYVTLKHTKNVLGAMTHLKLVQPTRLRRVPSLTTMNHWKSFKPADTIYG